MKALTNIILVVAVISVVIGVISRIIIAPVPIARGTGMEAHSFLAFANTCLLFAIALILKAKQ